MIFSKWLLAAVIVGWSTTALTDSKTVRAEFERAYADPTPSLEKQADSTELKEYVLYPYLQQHRLQTLLASATDDWKSIDAATEVFLKTHGVEPVARELRRVWYASLAKREQWELYFANYREVDDPVLRCHALTARLKLQQLDGLAPMVAQQWASSPGSLPACEIAFTWLKSQSAWTPALIERRARAALEADNPSFARQMTALLPPEIAAPLNQWASLIEQPQSAIDAAIQTPTSSVENKALIDGWTRLARRNADAAIQRYATLVRARKLDEATASRLALELALPLAWSRRAEAIDYFKKVRSADFDERSWEWYARSALWNDNWKLAANILGLMPSTLRQQTRWKYWQARATAALGDAASAKNQYASLLHDDNYYAVLAAARLDKPYTPEQRAIDPDDSQLQAIELQPPFQRARELHSMSDPDLREAAYDEWRFGYTKLSASARAQSVLLAARWGWHDQAILIAAEQRLFNDYVLLYPHQYDSDVDAAAKMTDLSSTLIYGVLRQESIFREDAVSSAGARGLMQVLPEYAGRTARRWNITWPADLFDSKTNIPLGAAHLKDILNRFNGRLLLAIAGYNAGPNAVVRWVPSKPKDSDVWVENIPYNETRIYVQRVLWHSIVFGWIRTHDAQSATGWLTTVGAEQQ